MAEGEKTGGDIKPGSWVGDTVEEFRKLPTWGKIAVGVIVVGVVGFAYYQYKQSQNSGSAVTPSTVASSLGIPGGATDSGSSGPATPTGTTSSSGAPTGSTSGSTSSSGSTTGSSSGSTSSSGSSSSTTTKKPPTPKLSTYTVQRGDTLSGIASKLHISGGWQALYAANKSAIGSNPNLIHAGLKLQVPA